MIIIVQGVAACLTLFSAFRDTSGNEERPLLLDFSLIHKLLDQYMLQCIWECSLQSKGLGASDNTQTCLGSCSSHA